MNAAEIRTRSGILLQDVAGVRWTQEEVNHWVEEAQSIIIQNAPNSASINHNLTVQSLSSKVSIPSGGYQLLDVISDLGEDGLSGDSVSVTTREHMDSSDRRWRTRTGTRITHYVYNPDLDRKNFYVYPKPESSTVLEILYTPTPPSIVNSSTDLILDHGWIPYVVDYVCFRCLSKDADYGTIPALAITYLQKFSSAIGQKYSIDSTMAVINRIIERRP